MISQKQNSSLLGAVSCAQLCHNTHMTSRNRISWSKIQISCKLAAKEPEQGETYTCRKLHRKSWRSSDRSYHTSLRGVRRCLFRAWGVTI
jgi:hypothetical protein